MVEEINEIMDNMENIQDLAETASETGGVGAGLLIGAAAAGSLIAAGVIAGGKTVVRKAQDFMSRRKAKKELDAAVAVEQESTEIKEATEATEK